MRVLARCLAMLGAVLMTLALAACSGSSSDTTDDGERSGGSGIAAASDGEIPVLTWAMPYPVNSLDEAKGYDGATLLGLSIGHEKLLAFNKDGTLRNVLAESWDETDATVFTYQIRRDVTFWNGDPLTAEDVAFSLGRHKDPKVASQMASMFTNVKSIEATGEHEVTVTLTKPDITWQYVPALTFIIQKAYAEQVGNDKLGSPEGLTMGTGPHRYTRFVPDQVLEAERYEGYWGPKPAAKKVVFRTFEDDSVRLLAMQSGEIDGSFVIPPESYDQWSALPNAYTYNAPGVESHFFLFDTSEPPFDDVHVRRAFAHALDPELLAEKFLQGQGVGATHFVPPAVWTNIMSPEEIDEFYASLPRYEFDLDKAREELAKSAHPDGFETTFFVPSATDQLSQAGLVLADNLKQIGITLHVKEMPPGEWNARLYSHDGLMFEGTGAFSENPDPSYFLSHISGTETQANGTNYALFENAEATELFERQTRTSDREARKEDLMRLAEIAAEEVPYLGVFWTYPNVAVSKDLVYDDLGPFIYPTNWAAKVKAAVSGG